MAVPPRRGGRLRQSIAALTVAASLLLTACTMPSNGISASGIHLAGPRGYATVRNQIIGPDGRPFLVHGVDRPSLEWSATGDHISAQDFRRMAAWGANTVRIALNQDFWLSTSCAYDPDYPGRVAAAVHWAEAAGLVVILDLHWSDEGRDQNGGLFCPVPPGQQAMADANSLTFWKQVAARYKDRHRGVRDDKA